MQSHGLKAIQAVIIGSRHENMLWGRPPWLIRKEVIDKDLRGRGEERKLKLED